MTVDKIVQRLQGGDVDGAVELIDSTYGGPITDMSYTRPLYDRQLTDEELEERQRRDEDPAELDF